MAKARPIEQFTGLTLEQWLSDVNNISWAQQEPRFKMILSVLLNASRTVPISECSEGRALGRVEGFMYALLVLQGLARKPDKPLRELEATFDEPAGIPKTNEPYD
jgi:hypothetical protein